MNARLEVPKLAIGHMRLESSDVSATLGFFHLVGCRLVVERQAFGIVELRGGTHIVIRGVDGVPRNPSFDLMVEDIAAVREQVLQAGLRPSEARDGGIHKSFEVIEPGGARLTFTSSHAMGPV